MAPPEPVAVQAVRGYGDVGDVMPAERLLYSNCKFSGPKYSPQSCGSAIPAPTIQVFQSTMRRISIFAKTQIFRGVVQFGMSSKINGHDSSRLMDAYSGPTSTQKVAGRRSQQSPRPHAPRSASTETIQDPMEYSNRFHERFIGHFIPIPPDRPCWADELFWPGATSPSPGGHHESLRRRRASKVTTSFSAYSNCKSKW